MTGANFKHKLELEHLFISSQTGYRKGVRVVQAILSTVTFIILIVTQQNSEWLAASIYLVFTSLLSAFATSVLLIGSMLGVANKHSFRVKAGISFCIDVVLFLLWCGAFVSVSYFTHLVYDYNLCNDMNGRTSTWSVRTTGLESGHNYNCGGSIALSVFSGIVALTFIVSFVQSGRIFGPIIGSRSVSATGV